MQNKMNTFRRNKINCVVAIALNLAGAVDPVFADPGQGTTLTLDGSISGNGYINGDLQSKVTQQSVEIKGSNVTIDAKELGVFSNGHNSVFFSFSKFVIDQGNLATFTCSAGGCINTQNVISRVVGNPAEIYGTLKSDITNQSPGGLGAAFYLMSDQGVIVGKNATIDVPGALHIGATNTLNFDDGSKLEAGPVDASTLNGNPQDFGFLNANSTSRIIIAKDDNTAGNGDIVHIKAIGPVELSAGTVEIVGGTLNAKTNLEFNTNGNTANIRASGEDPVNLYAITLYNNTSVKESSGGMLRLETNNPSGSILMGTNATLDNVTLVKSDFAGVTIRGRVNTASTLATESRFSAGGDLVVEQGGSINDSGSGNLTVTSDQGSITVDGEGSKISGGNSGDMVV